jgi:hypothetical protein
VKKEIPGLGVNGNTVVGHREMSVDLIEVDREGEGIHDGIRQKIIEVEAKWLLIQLEK